MLATDYPDLSAFSPFAYAVEVVYFWDDSAEVIAEHIADAKGAGFALAGQTFTGPGSIPTYLIFDKTA